jgi:hypothetical protein
VANPTLYSSYRHFIAVSKETVQGTPVAPTVTMPVDKFDPQDKPIFIEDNALRGSLTGPYNEVLGVSSSEFDVSGPAFFDTIGYLLANIFGDITETGSSAPYLHKFSTLNTGTGQPSSLTITDWEGPTPTVFARYYPGACLSELNLKGTPASSVVEFDAKGTSWPSVAAAGQPTSSPSAIPPQAAWQTKVGLAGTVVGQQIKTVSDWEVDIKRELEVIYTGSNVQVPYFIMRGKLTVGGKLSIVAADLTPLTYMTANTQPQLQLIIDNGLVGAGQLALQIDIQQDAFTESKINFSKTAVGYDVTWNAVANTTNAGTSAGFSPASISLTNAIAASIY